MEEEDYAGLAASINWDATPDGTLYFLPPLAPEPTDTGEFDDSLAPIILIWETDGTDIVGWPKAYFSMTTWWRRFRIRVNPQDEHYIANWHTKFHPWLKNNTIYRIMVIVDGIVYGQTDVKLVGKRKWWNWRRKRKGNWGRNHTSSDGADLYQLQYGSTLPIKFRIDRGGEPPVELADISGTVFDANGVPDLSQPAVSLFINGASGTRPTWCWRSSTTPPRAGRLP
jgi:hypothetical protein